ncbi:MAG TPA: helix-turn-helix domain-containing protein [Pyrinomonadaceae bacterium]
MSEDANILVENELLRRGFTSVPNYIFGLAISSNAKLIYMALLSYAWTNQACYPGLAKLCKDVSLSDKPVTKGIEELCRASLLEVKRRGLGKTNLYVIKDFTPTADGGTSSSESRIGESPNPESENLRIKDRRNAEARIGDAPTPESENLRITKKRFEKDPDENETGEEDTHPQAARAERGVCVGSRFSLDDCRRYAEHLRQAGEGITNPGGFAMSIHRSGVADEQIAAFLRPASAAPQLDASLCPDCAGTGFYFPGGPQKGVVKCKHKRLTDAAFEHATSAARHGGPQREL